MIWSAWMLGVEHPELERVACSYSAISAFRQWDESGCAKS
jgi:hypothetical protein